jgi:hypothetical protein
VLSLALSSSFIIFHHLSSTNNGTDTTDTNIPILWDSCCSSPFTPFPSISSATYALFAIFTIFAMS